MKSSYLAYGKLIDWIISLTTHVHSRIAYVTLLSSLSDVPATLP